VKVIAGHSTCWSDVPWSIDGAVSLTVDLNPKVTGPTRRSPQFPRSKGDRRHRNAPSTGAHLTGVPQQPGNDQSSLLEDRKTWPTRRRHAPMPICRFEPQFNQQMCRPEPRSGNQTKDGKNARNMISTLTCKRALPEALPADATHPLQGALCARPWPNGRMG